jgi:hypothetical protein
MNKDQLLPLQEKTGGISKQTDGLKADRQHEREMERDQVSVRPHSADVPAVCIFLHYAFLFICVNSDFRLGRHFCFKFEFL